MCKRTIMLFGVSLVAISGVAQARIQDVSSQATPQPDVTATTVDEIIVTAQRRDQQLSETPVAVAYLGAEQLAKSQIASEEDLRANVPGLAVRGTLSSNQLNYSLRGQSQDAYSATRPGVLPYVNEVQVPGSGATVFYDLASVQVLKGPQGTLFGRSATGGAVLFTTRDPGDDFGGYASLLGGDYDRFKVEGAVNLPLADTLNARVAAFYDKQDGFQKNIVFGGREGDLERYGARVSFDWQPTDRFDNKLSYEYYNTDSESTLAVISGLLPFTGAPPPYVPAAFLYAGAATPLALETGVATIQAFTGGLVPEAITRAYYSAYFSSRNHPAGGVGQYLIDQNSRGPFEVGTDGVNIYKSESDLIINRSSFDIGPNTQLKNIFGYYFVSGVQAQDADGTAYGIAQNGPRGSTDGLHFENRQFSNELQLTGDALGERLNYVIGGYYANEKRTELFQTYFFDIVFGGQTQHNDYVVRNETTAGYGQGTYALNDGGLSATAGIRYTREKVGRESLPSDTFRLSLGESPTIPGINYDQSTTFDNISWTLGIQQQYDDLLVYATTRRAYKSGGFNTQLIPIDAGAAEGGNQYDEESVSDIEAGAKFAGDMAGMRVTANLALYYSWIDGSQRTAYTLVQSNVATVTVNVPEGRIYGAEFDGMIHATDWLSLGGTLNYTNAEYTDGNVIANGSAQLFDQVPDTPEWTGTVFAEVRNQVAPRLEGVLRAEYFAQSETFTTPRSANSFGTTIDGYGLASFRAGIESDDGWSLTANVKNAFDKVHYVGGIPTGEIYQINTLLPGAPRTVTLQLRVDF